MLQPNSDFFFIRPMIYFGSLPEEEQEESEEECMFPFILEMDPNHPVQQKTGLYLHWFES